MATTPLHEEPRLRPAGNDEIRGRALVAHIEAQLAAPMPASSQQKPTSGPI